MNERRIILRVSSNIERYAVTIYDGCKMTQRQITARQGCLCLFVSSPCPRIVARPLTEGYSTLLYVWLDRSCQQIFNLYFAFPSDSVAPTPTTSLNRFTLTDATYGLPIDGTLVFTQA